MQYKEPGRVLVFALAALLLVGCSSDSGNKLQAEEVSSDPGQVAGPGILPPASPEPVTAPDPVTSEPVTSGPTTSGPVMPAPITSEPVVVPGTGGVADPAVRNESEIFAYRSSSAYGEAHKSCNPRPYDNAATDCTLEKLPFIAQQKPDFTRADVLDRLLVSHRWMGRRFEQLLNDAPDDLVQMFGSTTGIVISSDVRPSNYRAWTGSIRIDPRHLWMTVAEKRTILVQEDYRSDFGKDLRFNFYSSFRLGDSSAFSFVSLSGDGERSFNAIRLGFQELMYHELAHANDYAPPRLVATLPAEGTILDATVKMYESGGGTVLLYDDLPLFSSVLYGLGQVRFRGVTATAQQNSAEPGFVGAEMATDGATEFYSYSTEREDYANLVALTMMQMHHGVKLNIGFTVKPASAEFFCEDLTVGWGVRDRLANALVRQRARFAVWQIFGESAATKFLDGYQGQEGLMHTGENWCDNQTATAPLQNAQRSGVPRPAPVNRERSITW